MRAVAALCVLLALPARAEPPRIDAGVGLMTAARATSSQTGPSFGAAVNVPVTGPFQVRLESQAAPFQESNAVARLTRWEWRTALTADLVTSRQSVALRLGLGPALLLQPVRVVGDQAYGGTRARVGLRAHMGLAGRVRGPVGWRVGMGTVLSADHPGFDGLLAMTWTPGRGP